MDMQQKWETILHYVRIHYIQHIGEDYDTLFNLFFSYLRTFSCLNPPCTLKGCQSLKLAVAEPTKLHGIWIQLSFLSKRANAVKNSPGLGPALVKGAVKMMDCAEILSCES